MTYSIVALIQLIFDIIVMISLKKNKQFMKAIYIIAHFLIDICYGFGIYIIISAFDLQSAASFQK